MRKDLREIIRVDKLEESYPEHILNKIFYSGDNLKDYEYFRLSGFKDIQFYFVIDSPEYSKDISISQIPLSYISYISDYTDYYWDPYGYWNDDWEEDEYEIGIDYGNYIGNIGYNWEIKFENKLLEKRKKKNGMI